MSDLRDMPPGTYPPIVLKQDASSLPVALVTLERSGLNESKLKDLGQNFVRNQLASVPGASVPQPFGGRWRQIMLYADPYKLEANQLSPMDVVRAVNDANVILPAGDVQIGRYDYNIYTNSMLKGRTTLRRCRSRWWGSRRCVSAMSRRRRTLRAAVQHRACRRAARRLSADLQTGRRLEHHRHCGWRAREAEETVRRAGFAEERRWSSISRGSSRRRSRRCCMRAASGCFSPA